MVFVVYDLSLKTKNFLYFFYQRFRNVCLRREKNGPRAKRKREGGGGERGSVNRMIIFHQSFREVSLQVFGFLQKLLVCSLPIC